MFEFESMLKVVLAAVALYLFYRALKKNLFKQIRAHMDAVTESARKTLADSINRNVIERNVGLQNEVRRLREKRGWLTLFVRIYGLDKKYTDRTGRKNPTLYVPIQMNVSTGQLRAAPDGHCLIGCDDELRNGHFTAPEGEPTIPDFLVDLGCPPYRLINDYEVLMLGRVYTMLS